MAGEIVAPPRLSVGYSAKLAYLGSLFVDDAGKWFVSGSNSPFEYLDKLRLGDKGVLWEVTYGGRSRHGVGAGNPILFYRPLSGDDLLKVTPRMAADAFESGDTSILTTLLEESRDGFCGDLREHHVPATLDKVRADITCFLSPKID